MKEQDLHIGCSYLVTAGAIDKIITPTGRATLSAAFDYFSTGHLKGIPLTGEVLEKMGAEMVSKYYYTMNVLKFGIIHIYIRPLKGKKIEVELGQRLGYTLGYLQQFQYVHQLQLLYFSLTGEFLPYKQ